MKEIRIAWLLPVAWFYWQPALSEFTKLFPETTVFTGLFPGFAKGVEGSLRVEVVGQFRVIELTRDESSYGDNFTYLSPGIIGHLLRLRPQVIFSSSFGIWTVIALLLKPLFWWRVVIAYEGSSPGVDYRNSAIRLLVRRLMVKMADACITNSRAGATYLTEILRAASDRVFVQPYEIPDEKTLPGDSGSSETVFSGLQRPIFLFVGHLIPRKGLPTLLKACAILQERGYENYTLVAVGDGEQRKDLEAFCQEHQLIDRIEWAGRISYDKIGSYFKNADVFTFPTHEDTWGVVTLEAMLLGKPILCSKGAGTSELVIDGENGYVFTPNAAEELADLMQNFLDNPGLIGKMGERSKQIMAQYTPVAAAKCLAQVTELVMGKEMKLTKVAEAKEENKKTKLW
ncbi:glycosyltransferase family 4 protein [Phormidium sp. LEGE 05292]|uniref:glycosyltransferase family 4 protein n=1 Tax=[Phormidium] sp. LEGE 05292 TaxID=767427 RepID=UPI0018814449|nr:glycosyltransferase family 4 protein [Phormidium sp. LEGE 05292]MBE9228391.1 glycosyltransferase family 4 protein [Phormidium sp. LEGE 05292]